VVAGTASAHRPASAWPSNFSDGSGMLKILAAFEQSGSAD
jgi:hypothetical protein